MTVLPIVERELRVRARQKATFWVRFGAALGGVLICALLTPRYLGAADSAELGSALFGSLALTAYLICCIAFVLTSDVISVERREKTLGLLFLTRIKGLDVLLGKTVSSSLLAVSALAGYLPILMLPVLAGGVTGGEAVRNGLVILNQLLAGIAAGIWASSRGSDWFANTAKALAVSLALIPASAFAFGLADDRAYAGNIVGFWLATGLQHLMAWLLFLLALRRLQQGLQEEERAHATTIAPPGARTWASAAGTRSFRAGRERLTDGMNPIEWCVRHERGVRSAFWGAGILLLVCNSLSLAMPLVRGFGIGFSWLWSWWVIQLAFGLFAVALQAWAATRFFMETRHTGELEVLLSTPLGAGAVITGQWRALRRRMRGPILVSLLPIILHAATSLGWAVIGWREGMHWYALWVDFLRIVAGWFNIVAICWVGMWFALKATRPVAAIARTVVFTMGVPLVFTLLFPALVAFLGAALYSPNQGFSSQIALPWYAFSRSFALLPILWPVLLVFWARKQLQSDLRGIARVRFGVRSDWSEIREAWQRRRQGQEQLVGA